MLRVMTSLQRLHLDHNRMTGTLPHQLTEVITLKNLTLSENSFLGKIPAELAALTALGKCGSIEINFYLRPSA
jgi:hypothetical protein